VLCMLWMHAISRECLFIQLVRMHAVVDGGFARGCLFKSFKLESVPWPASCAPTFLVLASYLIDFLRRRILSLRIKSASCITILVVGVAPTTRSGGCLLVLDGSIERIG
jgi:hypothetical protein